ncbi:MAG TPA: hypothetical protein VF232_06875 [Gaiellaceae bacterium]
MLADELDYVIGVDTHRDQHTLAFVVAPTGAVLGRTVISANGRGYAQALRFADRHAGGVRVWSIEGAGHYGAVVTRYVGDRGETCWKGDRPLRQRSVPNAGSGRLMSNQRLARTGRPTTLSSRD